MYKLIVLIAAAMPAILLLRAIFGRRSQKASRALSDFKKQLDYLVWAILFVIGWVFVYSSASLIHSMWRWRALRGNRAARFRGVGLPAWQSVTIGNVEDDLWAMMVKAKGPSGPAKIRSDDPKPALGLVHHLRTIGYEAWIEDMNGNEIEERVLKNAIKVEVPAHP
jgi:hypothetical protein